jgi:hypothetical protein
MYSWGDGIDDWARPGGYSFDEARKAAHEHYAFLTGARGGRTYQTKYGPNEEVTTPKKTIFTKSPNPVVCAIDVTGSMQTWPAELFDRLPLLYQTLSQYRPDLEMAFAAIGDSGCDRWPLQVTDFEEGFELEDRVQALYGEGGGGDAPESYQLFAHYMNTRVETPGVPEGERPFLLVFGDECFHPYVTPTEVKRVLGDDIPQKLDGVTAWREVAKRWNVYFLRRPGGRRGDSIHDQWAKAIGDQKIIYVDDELRGMDYAMGIVARTWGHFDDFTLNMSARQSDDRVLTLTNSVLALDPDTRRRRGRKKREDKRTVPPTRRMVPKTRRSRTTNKKGAQKQ